MLITIPPYIWLCHCFDFTSLETITDREGGRHVPSCPIPTYSPYYPPIGWGTPPLPRIPPPYMGFEGSKRGDNPLCKVWIEKSGKNFWKNFWYLSVMSVYTNKEEKKEYGKVLTSLLKKQFPFILDVDVYGLESTGFFNIDCYLIVPKDFILENIKSNNDRRLNFGIREGVIPTFLFNDNSKRLKFNTEEFLKLCRLLFMSMFGEISDGNTYSVQFKMV